MSFELRKKYPQLEELMVIYFGPDFTDEYNSYDKALEAFCNNQTPEELRDTLREIKAYLDTKPKEKEAYNFLLQIGNHVNYAYDGFNAISWIAYIEKYIQNFLKKDT